MCICRLLVGYKCYFPTGKRIIVSKDVTFNERNMFYRQNHGELDNQDMEVRLMSPARDIEQNTSPHILFQTHEANSEYHENAQIPNYSKTPTYSQVYTRKGINLENIPNHSKAPLYGQVYIRKAKINDSNTEQTIDKPNEESTPSKTIQNEPADEATGTSKIDQSNIDLLEKRTTPYPLSSYITFSKLTNDYKTFLTILHNEYIPNNSEEAIKIPHWKLAMEEELRASEVNRTWDIVNLPLMKKPIGCRWVFTVKYLSDDKIER